MRLTVDNLHQRVEGVGARGHEDGVALLEAFLYPVLPQGLGCTRAMSK
jgi:hypothetical protein